jgi:hypothetical protein
MHDKTMLDMGSYKNDKQSIGKSVVLLERMDGTNMLDLKPCKQMTHQNFSLIARMLYSTTMLNT